MVTETASADLARHVHALAISPPVEARRQAARCVLDHLGCGLTGQGLTYVRHHFTAMSSWTAPAEVTCVDGTVRPAFAAAYLNGQSANALDYDDTLYGHPGGSIIAAALASAERSGGSVDRLLFAVVAGYEAHWLLTRAGSPTPKRAAQVRGVSAWDTMAAAVAAAAATNMTPESLERVLGVAAAQSTIPYVAKWYERPMPTVKNNLGWVAAGGILAVDLAASGAIGVPAPLDGPAAFWLMAGSDQWSWPTESPAAVPAILRAGFKRFPACWHLQQYLTVTDALLRESADRHSVAQVEIRGPDDLQKFVETEVYGPADVAFSLRTLTALLMSGIEPGAAWVDEAVLATVQPIVDKVVVRRGDDRSVAVTYRDGHRTEAPVPEADYTNPRRWGLSESEVEAKFIRLTTKVLGADVAQQLLTAVMDDAGDRPVATITRLMRR